LLAHGRWFSPGTPASPTTKTGRHDIAEILLKVALKHQKSNQNQSILCFVKKMYVFIAPVTVNSFITLREGCNNQRPRCDIAWPKVHLHFARGSGFQ